MNSERWSQVEQLYHAALEREPSERNALLAELCQGNEELLREVKSLLLQDNSADELTNTLVPDGAAPVPAEFEPAQLVAGAQLGPYQIEATLGVGGMGEVFRARDTRLRRTVAIKVLPRDKFSDPERKRRFLQEARAASALNHPNIVVVYDISNHGGTDFLVLEYVPGKTLKELLPANGLPFGDVSQYGAQIACALAAAHTAGIIHRDIKPANIMITPESQVKILDFGVAKLTEPASVGPETQTHVGSTSPGVVVGTVAYMSPEQARGEALDERSDIFSLGCVLYESTTGRQAFRGPNALAILHDIISSDPPIPSSLRPGLPPSFDLVITKCLRKDPDQRFQTMTDVSAALREAPFGRRSAGIAVSTSIPSIAVLPFANMSGSQENEYLSDGLAEELINALTRIDDLRVTARTSAFSFRGKALDVREIGKKLNVGAVLEGSVRSSGKRLRISAQLISVSDGYHIWSERYDREMTDVFDIQDEISRAIVEKLRPRLLGQAPAAEGVTLATRHTKDPDAYGLYLKGRYYWSKQRPGMYLRVIEYFEQAISRDPQYALAYAGIADAYNVLGGWEAGILSPEEASKKSRAHAERALQLDPDLAEGRTALGYSLLQFAWDLPAAERLFTDAIRLNPRYGPAHHWYSHLLVAANRLEESLAESLAYLKVDPADSVSSAHLSWHYLMSHEFDKALVACRRGLGDEPTFVWHHVFHSWALLNSGALAEASAEMSQAADLAGSQLAILGSMAHAHAVSGRREEASRLLDQLSEISKTRYVAPYVIGMVHEALGNTEEAFWWWERAYEERSPWLIYLAREHRLRHLHGQPKFDALVARVSGDLRGQERAI